MRRSVFLLAFLAVLVALVPRSRARAPWLGAAPGLAAASFLQQPGSAAWLAGGGGTGRSHLPTSAMPNSGGLRSFCSVDTQDLAPCSATEGGPVAVCSAHGDAQQFCSAFGAVAFNLVSCSVLGGRTRCSVLQPLLPRGLGSFCSAQTNVQQTEITCSVVGAARKAACSGQNPAGPGQTDNYCSAIAFLGARLSCSALDAGGLSPDFCSTALAANPVRPMLCSVFETDERCSVLLGGRGACSAFKQAPAVSCTAHGSPLGHCSVIGGPSGSRCRQP